MTTVINGTTGINQITDGSVTAPDFATNAVENYMTAPFSFRNKLINGSFKIWQRGTSFSNAGYNADRWYQFGGATGLTFTNPSTSTVAINCNSATNLHYVQAMESDTVLTMWGKSVTFSITSWVGAGTVPVFFVISKNNTANTIGGGSWVDIATINPTLTTIPTRYLVTTTIPSDGTANGLKVGIYAGSVSGNVNIFLNSAQLEVGTVATPFEDRPIGLELQLCQRYYNSVEVGVRSVAPTVNGFSFSINHPVPMRVTPVMTAPVLIDANFTTAANPAVGTWGLQLYGASVATKTGTFTFNLTPLGGNSTVSCYGVTITGAYHAIYSNQIYVGLNAEL